MCMSFLSSNLSYTVTDIGTCNLMDHSKSNNEMIILTSLTFTVTLSHTGTSGSNVMVQIEVNKNDNVSCAKFPSKMSF